MRKAEPRRISAPEDKPATERAGFAPFHAHVELLQFFIAHRNEIVEKIAGLLNAQRKPDQYLQDGPLLARYIDNCFVTLSGVSTDASRLKHQLEEAHWASGFRPRKSPGMYNELVDSAEMMVRGFYLWQRTHWPGHSGRVRFAHTLFNLHVLRCLALLSMRLWDAGTSEAAGRLAQVQDVLEHLWETAPKDQPIFVRNARWLIPLAQSPTTDELAGYFAVAEQIAKSFSEEDRNEILRAGIRMAGGHLRTQLRHVSLKRGVSFDDRSVVSSTRTSNALDVAMLIQSLVPILEAYEFACDSGFNQKRLDLAATICQGISPDPELFLNRLDLLGPYSMIEYLFITTDGDGDGQVVYTPMGQRHIQRLQKYEDLIRRLRKPLLEDCPRFRPVDGVYSPYGVIFGYSYNLIEHMALKSLRPDIETHFSLEDVFTEGDADKRAWVSGWRKLPHIKPEVTKLFEYPQQFAEDIFARIEQALQQGVSDSEKNAAVHTGLLFILPADGPNTDSPAWQIPDLPPEYIRSSDQQFAASRNTASYNESDLSHSRLEGEFLVSYKSTGGWVAISKDALTEVLGAGQDVKLVGLPPAAAEVVKGMCRDLVVTE